MINLPHHRMPFLAKLINFYQNEQRYSFLLQHENLHDIQLRHKQCRVVLSFDTKIFLFPGTLGFAAMTINTGQRRFNKSMLVKRTDKQADYAKYKYVSVK